MPLSASLDKRVQGNDTSGRQEVAEKKKTTKAEIKDTMVR